MLKRNIVRAISRFGKTVEVLRNGVNEFGEPTTGAKVVSVKGYFHKGNLQLGYNTTISGQNTSNYSEKLLVVNDDDSSLIQVGDYFIFDGIAYQIIDMGNCQDVYFDMQLKRM